MNENLSPVQIGHRIKIKLNELGLRQKDLVKKTGLSKNAISNYINGNRIPDTTAIYKLSKELNTSIEWLLEGNNYYKPNNFTSKKNESPEGGITKNADYAIITLNVTDLEKDILDMFRKLDEREQHKIEGMLELKISEKKSKEKSSTCQNGGAKAIKVKKHA